MSAINLKELRSAIKDSMNTDIYHEDKTYYELDDNTFLNKIIDKEIKEYDICLEY